MKEKKNIFRKICRLVCHQKEERCFKIKNYVFPICSRCTGILISFIISLILIINKYYINIWIAIVLLLIMFIDWLLQYFKILMSTNLRRFITGLIGGVGLTYFYYYIIIFIEIFL